MKKCLSGLAIGWLCVGFAGLSHAANVAVTYTADNAIGAWFVDGVSQILGSNAGNWRQSDTANLELSNGSVHSIIWYAYNYGGAPTNQYPDTTGNNPAAFLAQITGDVVGGPILTASHSVWEYAIAPEPDPNTQFNFDGWKWQTVDTDFEPNAGTSIWNGNQNEGIRGINTIASDAQWIWSHNPEEAVYFRTRFTTTGAPDPVPEPATMILFGAGLTGLAALRRRKQVS